MKLFQNTIELLKNYIASNEVVYQVCGELIEVSNNYNIDNRETLLGYFNHVTNIKIYKKCASFVHKQFEDLDNWATQDDVLFLLGTNDVLICIPQTEAIKNMLIEE